MALCFTCLEEEDKETIIPSGETYCERHKQLRQQKQLKEESKTEHLQEFKSFTQCKKVIDFDQRTLNSEGEGVGDGICFGLVISWFEALCTSFMPSSQACLDQVITSPGNSIQYQEAREKVQKKFFGKTGAFFEPIVATLEKLGHAHGFTTSLCPLGSDSGNYTMFDFVEELCALGAVPGSCALLSFRSEITAAVHACGLYIGEEGVAQA